MTLKDLFINNESKKKFERKLDNTKSMTPKLFFKLNKIESLPILINKTQRQCKLPITIMKEGILIKIL